jgi:hypothetical protein
LYSRVMYAQHPEDLQIDECGGEMNDLRILRLGYPEEGEDFLNRHKLFFEQYDSLRALMEMVFVRTAEIRSLADRLVLNLGNLIIEEFMEILCLAASGYGDGGLKILRGMYERLVNLYYIADNSQDDEMPQLYADYFHVNRRRQLNHLIDLLPEYSKDVYPKETIEEVEGEYARVKQKFPNKQFWSGFDLRTLAKKVGLEKLYLPCYFDPTLLLHGSIQALMKRIDIDGEGEVSFNRGPQRDSADTALWGAHLCLVGNLDRQNRYFRLGLDNEVQEQFAIAEKCWRPRDIAALDGRSVSKKDLK